MTIEFQYLKEVKKYCDDLTIDRFHVYGDKIIAVVFDIDVQPEKGKTIGRVVLKGIAPKFQLGQYVKFNDDKMKFWTREINGKRLVVVNAYWCKKYIPETRLMVPIKVWRPKKKEFEVEFQLMTKKQFIARRTREMEGNWPHKYALAVENCNNLRSKGRYFAINATVKQFAVEQKQLESYWGKFNRFLAVLNREWDKLFRLNYEQDFAFRQIESINNNLREKKIDEKLNNNVIQLKKSV